MNANASRPVRRRPSARVRRRRALVLVIAGALAFGAVYLASGRSTPKRAVSKRSRSTGTEPAPLTRLEATPAVWQLPAPISRAVVVPDGRSMIVLGGLDGAQTSASGVVRVDAATGVSTTMGSLAFATHDAAGAVIGGKYFVFGGGEQVSVDTVQAVGSDGSAAIVGHLPQPRSDLSSVTIGSTVYLVGGYDGTTATREVLATTDGTTFRVVAQLPIGVRYAAVGAVGQTLYVFGGEWAGIESDAVQAIDTRTGRARIAGHLPAPLTEAVAVNFGGSLYVVGGRSRGVASAGILRFDPTTARFSRAGSLPSGVANAAIAVVGGSAYLVGGESTAPVSGVVVLTPTT